ncbi:MAG: hypothetical protein RQ758_02265 [Methanomicrobiaceae archaeon]|nr:hypothetical protein [Methanomicrobiaceae archaeon]
MGFAEDVIHSYITRSLRRVFPEREGWEIRRRPKENHSIPDYFLQKKRFGRTRRVLVEVSLLPKVTQSQIDSLRQYAVKMERLLLPTDTLMMVVPTGADVSLVPEEIEVLSFDVLRVEGDEIVWVKKFGRGGDQDVADLPDTGSP